MKRIYSCVEPSRLIMAELRKGEITKYRSDMSPEKEFLQVSGRKANKDLKVKAHKHLSIDRDSNITQEAWIVVDGSLRGVFYDIDNNILYDTILERGDCVVLYSGGHSLEILEDDTLFYEIKTGPYFGLEADKENIY